MTCQQFNNGFDIVGNCQGVIYFMPKQMISQARRNEIDIGGAVNKADCTGLRENFCSTTPFRLLESNLAIQIAIFNG